MLWINLYKSSLHPEGGLLTSSYYADISAPDLASFWEFSKYVRGFDMAFEGEQTQLLLMTAQTAGSAENFQGGKSWVWAPTSTEVRGARPVGNPAPWRWCLNVASWGGLGRPSHHWHHYSVDTSEITCDTKGRAVWKAPNDLRGEMSNWFGPFGSHYSEWMRNGHGSATPGNALTFEPVRGVLPVGVSQMNKARKRQAQIFHRAVDFQAKMVDAMQKTAIAYDELSYYKALDTGHWIPEAIRPLITNIIGGVVGMAQLHKDNNKGDDGKKLNDGGGWAVRFGPTGDTIEGQYDKLDQKREEDLKFLQKFPPFADASGDLYFNNSDAREWFRVGFDWATYIGAFGGFDFLNPFQKGLDEKTRLDNYTPLWPDLPTKVEGLPRPQKNRACMVQTPEFLV